jgi:hypothetical protein
MFECVNVRKMRLFANGHTAMLKSDLEKQVTPL